MFNAIHCNYRNKSYREKETFIFLFCLLEINQTRNKCLKLTLKIVLFCPSSDNKQTKKTARHHFYLEKNSITN